MIENDNKVLDDKIKKKPLIKWGWVRALILILGGGFGVMYVVRIVKRSTIYSEDVKLHWLETMLLSQLITFLGFLLAIVLLRKFIDRKSMLSLGFSIKSKYRQDLLIGFGAGAFMIAIIFIILILTESIKVTSAQFPAYHLLLLLGIFIIAAVSEEIIWRGYVLNNFICSMNKYWALLVPTFFFALIHADSPTITVIGFVNIVLAGILFGLYYIHRKNLWFPIGLHIGWNLFQGPILGSPVSGNEVPSIFEIELTGSEILTGGGFGFEGSIIGPILLIIAIILVQLKYQEKN